MFTTCGSVIVYLIGPFFSYQVIVYVGMAISIIFTIAVLSISESPMYYVMKGTFIIYLYNIVSSLLGSYTGFCFI